jgi:hypothetical protein
MVRQYDDLDMARMATVARSTPPNQRMQPTGRSDARLRSGGALLAGAKERRFVRLRARGPAADLQFVSNCLEVKCSRVCVPAAMACRSERSR